ncbi:MAG: DUF3604 domain-containing protein [Deltaproteobacteria bacterium]|nr:DUF3604 domain-containing protein [Deltaproteobacteria bacterium]
MRKFLWLGLLFAIGAGLASYALGRGWLGVRQDGGEVATEPIPTRWVEEAAARQRAAGREIGQREPQQILFGDLHVHTTFSFDAFMVSLPMAQGEGAHPPADACDFARFCAGLDFWSINDHAEGLTPHQWAETKRAVRQCQAVAGESETPDMVSFLGWEWTQIGTTPENHYGHKNVVLLDLEEEAVPTRPISSRRELFPPGSGATRLGLPIRLLMIAASPGSEDRQPYFDLARFLQDRDDLEPCPPGIPVRELPASCQETAPTPGELFAKLDEWEIPYLVIPHGNTWGFYTPPGTSWDKQLAAHDDPGRREPLFEIFSGHGNSEEYREWRAVRFDVQGVARCPEPGAGYVPSCWRAGEIIRERCAAAGESAAECEQRAREARQNYVDAGNAGHVTVPAAAVEDWLDSGQCRDCYLPAFNYRPGGSGQYALALTNFDDPTHPKRFRFGFIASSDNHTARPGTGYKEQNRREMTDAGLGAIGSYIPKDDTPKPRSVSLESGVRPVPEFERFASFFGTGGLVAVHSSGRDRHSIWAALERKEVYGTSGERILLWFDLLTSPGSALPMGSRVSSAENPRFRVRAVGAFRQEPGCPEHSVSALSTERLRDLCRNECYNPSDERRHITRIEVIRIRPQAAPGEPVADLIEDPWQVLLCAPDAAGCSVEFSDPDFAVARRDTLYYVRAIQEPTTAINGAQLRSEFDEAGQCRSVLPCYADAKTEYEDDCLAEGEERAWSSPIYLEFARDDE